VQAESQGAAEMVQFGWGHVRGFPVRPPHGRVVSVVRIGATVASSGIAFSARRGVPGNPRRALRFCLVVKGCVFSVTMLFCRVHARAPPAAGQDWCASFQRLWRAPIHL